MYLSARKVPYEPRFHRSEKQLAPLCTFHYLSITVKYIAYLCCGKIRVNEQSRSLTDKVRQASFYKTGAHIRSSPALPYYRICHRLSRCFIPYHSGFTLICDTYCGNITAFRTYFQHCFFCNAYLRRPYLHCIVLHPARLRIILRELLLCRAYGRTVSVE